MNMTDLIAAALADPLQSWSVGTLGAIGEFRWDADEAAETPDPLTRITARGGLRVTPHEDATIIAYDTLSSDGETWGQSVAMCLAAAGAGEGGVVRKLGPDREALRVEDRDAILFDLGVGLGHVRMCARTRDEGLIAALDALEGKPVLGPEAGALMGEIVRAQPHRVLLSPVARLEVYSDVPPPGGESPVGPHTHLIPKSIASGRTHAANAPIPEGLQPVLMLHPRSPWRDDMGKRTPYDAELDRRFEALLERFGLEDDRAVRRRVETAVSRQEDPGGFAWPDTRRGRAQGRIALRRLAVRQPEAVAGWRQAFDVRAGDEYEEAN